VLQSERVNADDESRATADDDEEEVGLSSSTAAHVARLDCGRAPSGSRSPLARLARHQGHPPQAPRPLHPLRLVLPPGVPSTRHGTRHASRPALPLVPRLRRRGNLRAHPRTLGQARLLVSPLSSRSLSTFPLSLPPADAQALAHRYPNEIIEWPVVLLQWRRKSRTASSTTPGEDDDDADEWELVKTAEYHSFVKPVWAPKLSAFCTELTGITQVRPLLLPLTSLSADPADLSLGAPPPSQADVDKAPTFPELCKRFYNDFILPRRLFTPENRAVWVTDGPWGASSLPLLFSSGSLLRATDGRTRSTHADLRDFVAKTCYLSKTPRPPWLAGDIIDLRNLAAAFFSSLKKRSPSPSTLPSPSRGSAPIGDDSVEVPSTPAPLPAPLAPAHAVVPPPSTSTSSEPSTSTSDPPYLPSHALTAPPNLSLPSVLAALTLAPFEGRLHSGLCDARNAARILVDLAARGVALEANRRVPEGGKGARERSWGWMRTAGAGAGGAGGAGRAEVKWDEWSRKEGERFEREVREGKRQPWVRR